MRTVRVGRPDGAAQIWCRSAASSVGIQCGGRLLVGVLPMQALLGVQA